MARWALTLVIVLASGLGCGPVLYVNEVTLHAADAVDEARAAQADKYAPYYWTRATQYLVMAREQAARADFQGANHFGKLATEAGKQAVDEAALAKQDPSRMPLDVAPGKAKDRATAPAKDDAPAKVAPAKDEP
jgi:sRNA-binding protein